MGVRVLYLVIVGSTFSNSGVRVLYLVIVGFVFIQWPGSLETVYRKRTDNTMAG